MAENRAFPIKFQLNLREYSTVMDRKIGKFNKLNQFYNNITDDVNYTFSQSHLISF